MKTADYQAAKAIIRSAMVSLHYGERNSRLDWQSQESRDLCAGLRILNDAWSHLLDQVEA